MTEKDRFGDILSRKQKADEGRYIAEQDRLKLEKLRQRMQSEQSARGLCPQCGDTLVDDVHDAMEVKSCGKCRGVWIDADKLQQMLERASEGEFVKFFRSLLK